MNLKITIACKKLNEFGSLTDILFKKYMNDLTYMQYYNLRVLFKKITDKYYRYSDRPNKEISLTIDINIYASLLMLYNVSGDFLNDAKYIYEQELFRSVIMQINKQRTNLIPGNSLRLT